MKKPPRKEAARVCLSFWSDHMPTGSASCVESGIIMVEMMLCTWLIMDRKLADLRAEVNPRPVGHAERSAFPPKSEATNPLCECPLRGMKSGSRGQR